MVQDGEDDGWDEVSGNWGRGRSLLLIDGHLVPPMSSLVPTSCRTYLLPRTSLSRPLASLMDCQLFWHKGLGRMRCPSRGAPFRDERQSQTDLHLTARLRREREAI